MNKQNEEKENNRDLYIPGYLPVSWKGDAHSNWEWTQAMEELERVGSEYEHETLHLSTSS